MVMLSLNPLTKPTFLINYLSLVFTTENIQSTHIPEESPYPDTQPLLFSAADALQLLTSLEAHKAPGPDQIPPHLL